MIKIYYVLTKPGIVLGNIITTAAGFALASRGHIDYWLFLATLIGLSFVIASACILNNYIDRVIDEKMERTKNRAFAKGLISVRNAMLFAIALVMIGIFILAFYTNLLTAFIAFAGFFFYVVMYSFWKYRSVYGTLIGSLAGAVPPVVGYCAVSNSFDGGAFLLFVILVLWQMPHFFAIAIYRFDDYLAASIPVLPVKRGMYVTKVQMLLYTIAYIIATLMLTVFGYTGYAYLSVAALLGLTWLYFSIKGFNCSNDTLWARNMFRVSLVIVTALCFMISVDVV